MEIHAAQREVREAYVGGFPGLLISSLVWFSAAAAGAWISWSAAMRVLVIGGAFIFLGLELLLRGTDHNPSLGRKNPLNPLLLQTAFLLPLLLPLIAAAFHFRDDWLFPAFMIALGAHFLPFMFAFGMWQFGALGILMAGSGMVFGLAGGEHFTIAGWYGGAVQMLFAFMGLDAVRRERAERRVRHG